MFKTISIGNKDYKVKYKYGKRAKYVRLQIRGGQIELIIPPKVSIGEAEKFLTKKGDWITKQLSKHNHIQYKFLGSKIEINLHNDFLMKNIYFEFINDKLKVSLPSSLNRTEEEIFDYWLMLKANEYLITRTEELAEKYNFIYRTVSVKNQKTIWGSCSKKKHLSLNYKLMKLEKEIIDYVIIHELCHLREMNHSPRFWKHVEQILPGFKQVRKKLRSNII